MEITEASYILDIFNQNGGRIDFFDKWGS